MSYLCPNVLLRTQSYCTKATHRTSFYLNYHFKGPKQIQSHFKVLGVKTTTYSCCCYLAAQSCLTVCNPMDCSPPGSSVHGISQACILEGVALSFSMGSLHPGIKPACPALASRFFIAESLGKLQAKITIQLVILQSPWVPILNTSRLVFKFFPTDINFFLLFLVIVDRLVFYQCPLSHIS